MKPLYQTLTRLFLGVVLVGCTASFPSDSSTPAPAGDILTHILELNRSGRWDEAAQAARQFLDSNPTASASAKCQAYHHLAYANTRLEDPEAAKEAVSQFDQQCSELPAELQWAQLEMEKLKVELGMSTPMPVETHDDGFWQTVDPASLGIDSHVLAQHQALCEETGADACIVIYEGKIVQEWYSPRYYVPMYAMSSTKSVAGLLLGMLVDDGKVKSIDEPVCAYISEWCEEDKAQITLRHLLSMTSGLRRMWEDGVGSVGDKNPFVIALPLSYEPGTHWDYSNEGAQLLSPILDRAAGEPIQDYARKRLFEPLGMMDTRLHWDTAGHAWTCADMETTLRDFARIGLLMLNQGRWGEQQIVSERWVEQSTSPSRKLNPNYGLLWWLIDDPQGFAAYGHLETNLYVFPDLDLVVARMQRNPSDMPEGSYEPEALPLFKQLID
jgi:hypothetical protein